MTREIVDEIFYLFERNRKAARQRYREAYNVKPDDPALDEQLDAILRAHWRADDHEEFLVPAKLILGIILRVRGQGRGRKRPPKERWSRRQADLAVRIASSRWAELVREGMPSKRAKETAASEILPRLRTEFEFAAISKSTLLSRMRLNFAGRRKVRSR